jgi:hypothetical protein
LAQIPIADPPIEPRRASRRRWWLGGVVAVVLVPGSAPEFGTHGPWFQECRFDRFTPTAFTLDHDTLTAKLGDGEAAVLTRTK